MTGETKARRLLFTEPRRVEIESRALPGPGEGELLVASRVSAISAGTELLVYRGEVPEKARVDTHLPALSGAFRYPLAYGYAVVGDVLEAGAGADQSLLGRRVLSFQPHQSHFLARASELFPVPEDLGDERAALLPTAETAANLVLDARPLAGEEILVVGQGMVGLLTTALLARFPLERLWTVEFFEKRRVLSKEWGASRCLSPEEVLQNDGSLTEAFAREWASGADLAFELSGRPSGLQLAIAATGFEGRVLVGSWYGTKKESVALDTHFHRERIRLISSQVSHIGSALRSRWDRSRRRGLAWRLLRALPGGSFSPHRIALERAPEAYALLDERPGEVLQVLLTYT